MRRALCLRTCTAIRAYSCMCKYEHVVCMSVRVPAPLKCLGVAEKPDCVEDGVFIDCFMSSWVIYMRYSGRTTGWKKLVWEQSHPKSLFRSACLHLDDASSVRSRWSSVGSCRVQSSVGAHVASHKPHASPCAPQPVTQRFSVGQVASTRRRATTAAFRKYGRPGNNHKQNH